MNIRIMLFLVQILHYTALEIAIIILISEHMITLGVKYLSVCIRAFAHVPSSYDLLCNCCYITLLTHLHLREQEQYM